jgi:hypothetical protein
MALEARFGGEESIPAFVSRAAGPGAPQSLRGGRGESAPLRQGGHFSGLQGGLQEKGEDPRPGQRGDRQFLRRPARRSPPGAANFYQRLFPNAGGAISRARGPARGRPPGAAAAQSQVSLSQPFALSQSDARRQKAKTPECQDFGFFSELGRVKKVTAEKMAKQPESGFSGFVPENPRGFSQCRARLSGRPLPPWPHA